MRDVAIGAVYLSISIVAYPLLGGLIALVIPIWDGGWALVGSGFDTVRAGNAFEFSQRRGGSPYQAMSYGLLIGLMFFFVVVVSRFMMERWPHERE